ncbi:MAG: tetratricopeptide repeat protein [Candidatus Omnitrophica bacterium]|nr:tetratricopeptide repeat protein [Candidatus Omnitrophota bacterium]
MQNITLRINAFFESLTSLKVFLILLALGAVAYLQTMWYSFVHDDFVFIVGNPDIGRLDDLKEVFLRSSRFEGGSPIVNLYYRPILDIVYKIQYYLFGSYPSGYHLTNVFLHIFNSFFIFWIVRFLLKEKKIALIGATLFLLHPVQTESVCAIAGISNLLMTLFCLLGFVFYLRSGNCSTRTKRSWLYMGSILFFVLSLFTKERAIVFPLLILCYEFCRVNFKVRLRQIKEIGFRCVAFFVVLLGYFKFRSIVLGKSLPDFASNTQELWLRIASIPETLLVYFGILVFPSNLHYYRSQDILLYSVFSTLGLIAVLLLLLYVVKFFFKEERQIALFGLGWFFISLLPVLNIVPLINEYSIILTSEHFLYFSFLGFVLFLMTLLKVLQQRIFLRNFRGISYGFFIAILLIFSVLTIHQSRYWRGEIPLFKRTLQFEENLGRVRILLARAYYFDHSYDKAIIEYQRALKIMQEYMMKAAGTKAESFYLNFIKEIHFDLAHCYEGKKDFERSIEEYRQVLAIDPNDFKIYTNIGVSYFHMKDFDNAILYFNKTLEADPANIGVLNNLAFCYMEKNDLLKAKEILEEISRIDSSSELPQDRLKKMMDSQKREKK